MAADGGRPAPDGSIFIANGYGDSRLFRFDKNGNYRASYAGKGKTDGLFDCCHGLAVDTRYDQPLMLVCDRENRRLCHFDFDGKFVSTVTQHLRRPCQVSFHGDCAWSLNWKAASPFSTATTLRWPSSATIRKRQQWANYQLQPGDIAPAFFSAAHGCHIDQQANIYVSDWNHTGRVTKLARRS